MVFSAVTAEYVYCRTCVDRSGSRRDFAQHDCPHSFAQFSQLFHRHVIRQTVQFGKQPPDMSSADLPPVWLHALESQSTHLITLFRVNKQALEKDPVREMRLSGENAAANTSWAFLSTLAKALYGGCKRLHKAKNTIKSLTMKPYMSAWKTK